MLLLPARTACFEQALQKICLLAAALAILSAAVPAAAYAAPLADSAPAKLARILEQPEFAGRRVEKSQIAKLKEIALNKVRDYLLRAKRWLGGVKVPDTGDSRFMKALKRILAPIADVLIWLIELLMRLGGVLAFCAFFGVLGYAAYRWYKERKLSEAVEPVQPLPEAGPVSRQAVSVLVEMGRLADAVSELRLAVRRVLEDNYGMRSSETDRRLLSRVPAADPRRKVFGDTAALFEQSAYAGQPLDQEQVRALYRSARAEMGDEL